MLKPSRLIQLAHEKPEMWVTVVLSVPMTSLMGAYGLLVIHDQHQELEQAAEQRGIALAKGLSLIGATAMLDNLFLVQTALMKEIQNDPNIRSVEVLDRTHMITAAEDVRNIGLTFDLSHIEEIDQHRPFVRRQGEGSERFVIFDPLTADDELLGRIRVESSLTHVNDAL